MAMEVDKEIGGNAGLNAAIRSAKKAAKPSKIGMALTKGPAPLKHGPKSKARPRTASTFELDLSARRVRSEGIRAKKGDAVGRMGKRKNGKQ